MSHVHIPELAAMMRLSASTLYSDWRARVRRGEIPAPDPRYSRPTWWQPALEAFFATPKAERAEVARRRDQAADPDADGLRARMKGNRHAA